MKFKDEEILFGIKVNDNLVLNYVYDKYFISISSFVISNNGTKEDAEDVFQEAIIIIFRKIKFEQLTLTCSFYTYIFSICKKLWLKQLRQKHLQITLDENDYIYDYDIDEDFINKNEKLSLYQKHFKKLKKKCQNILQLSIKSIPIIEIVKKTGYKNIKSAIAKKYRCKKQLISKIKADPAYKQIIKY